MGQKNKENYIDNKLIDSEIYYNLNDKEIKRKQTDLESFGIEDIAIQASDQQNNDGGNHHIMRIPKNERRKEKVDN